MLKLKVGDWYLSKRGALCRVDEIPEEGNIIVTAHYSGSRLKIPREQAEFFKKTSKPTIEPGTMALNSIPKKKIEDYDSLYEKYPHIIRGSIYNVKSVMANKEELVVIDGKSRLKKNKVAKGATRCKIKCETTKCKGTRDIKVQDAFHVHHCDECREVIRKENLKRFLEKKKLERAKL